MFAILALAGDLGCITGSETVSIAAKTVGENNLKTGLLAAIVFPLIMLTGVVIYQKAGSRERAAGISGLIIREARRMGKKVYAVKAGRNPGIYNSWDICKKQIDGYSNAVYKSFTDLEEAKAFLGDGTKEEAVTCEAYAYIDGSYDNSKKVYAYAGIIFDKEKKVTFSKAENNPELVNLRNVAGEIKAAMYVMDYAVKNEIKAIEILYDYAGIEKWATHEWRANLPFTKSYAQYADEIKKLVKVKFTKVKAHTGVEFNEEVDALAKQAVRDFGPSLQI